MKDIVRRIARPEKTITSDATVLQRLSPTRYEVVDVVGRMKVVECSEGDFYPAGVRVIVQNERIVGSGRRLGKHRVYHG